MLTCYILSLESIKGEVQWTHVKTTDFTTKKTPDNYESFFFHIDQSFILL